MRNLAEEFLFRIQKPIGNHYGKTHFLYRPVVVIAQFVTKWNYNNYIYQILHRPTSGRGLTKNGWCISVLDQTSWFWKTRTCALWRQCGWATDNLKWHRDLNHLSFYELRKRLHLMENIFQRKILWSHPVSSDLSSVKWEFFAKLPTLPKRLTCGFRCINFGPRWVWSILVLNETSLCEWHGYF